MPTASQHNLDTTTASVAMSSTAASVSLAEMLDSAPTEPRASVREQIDRCLHVLPADQRLAHVLEAITACQMRHAQTVEFVAEAWAYLQEHELWRVDSERRFASLENLKAHLDTQVNLSHMLESHAKLSRRRRTALDAIAAEWGRNLSDVLPNLLPPWLSDKLLRGLSQLSRLVGGQEAAELLHFAVGARLQRPYHRKDEYLTVDDVTRVLDQLSSRLTPQGSGPAPAANRAHSTPAYVLRVGRFGTVGTPGRTRASARLLARTTKDAGVVTNLHKLARPTGREDNDEGGGEDDEDCEDDDDDEVESGEQGGDGEHSQDEVEDTDGSECEEAFRANIRRTHRAKLLRCGCAPICASLISRIPHGGPRLGDEKGADLLKRSHGLGWENICHNHIRRLAGALSMYTNHSRFELIKRLKLVFHYRTNLREPRNKKPRYFRLAGRETRSRLGLYRYAARRTDTFSFDAKRVFNRFAGSPSAWDTFQHDGTINVDRVFEYLFTPEILVLIEEEFEMYFYHLGSEQDGQKRRGWMRHMFYSLIHQLVRQDPVYYAMTAAARPDQNSWLISYPYYVKYQIAGESSGFAHFDISVDEFVKTGRGRNIVQGSLSLDDETENGCTLLVPGFHRHIHEWWARVKQRGRDTSGYTTNAKKIYSPSSSTISAS